MPSTPKRVLLSSVLLSALAPAQGWTPLVSPTWDFEFPQVVTDFGRGRLTTVDRLGMTWEWDGAGWREMGAGQTNSQIVYDSVRQRTLMFAFNTVSTYHEWNGHAWEQQPIAVPLPSINPMAFDAGRNVVVTIDSLNVLHEWDGASWTAHGMTPAAAWPRLVYDSARQELLMLSHGNINTPMSTHSWDGVAWQLRSGIGPQNPHFGVADDPLRGRVVVHGGAAPSSPGSRATWEWDGSQWALVQANGPLQRFNAALAFDPVSGRVLAFGGVSSTATVMQDAWAWTGVTWQPVSESAPPSRSVFATQFDGTNRRLVLHGGRVDGTTTDELWEFDGLRWRRPQAPGGPGARDFHAMAQGLSGGVLLFGGVDGGNQFRNDFWRWSGSAWTAITAPGPSPRASHGMVTDPVRGRVVLYGGTTGGFSNLRDTWEWDGAQWAQMATGGPTSFFVAPTPLTHDPVAAGVLMHIALGQPGVWLWSGAAWTNVAGPLADLIVGFGFDARRGATVAVTRPSLFRTDTWQLTPSGWTLVSGMVPAVLGRFASAGAGRIEMDDRARSLFYTGTFLWSDTATQAAADDVGPACTEASIVTPLLTSFGLPRIGDLDYELDVRAAPLRVGIAGFSTHPATVPFGSNCDWLIDTGPHVLVVTDSAGLTTVPLPLNPRPGVFGLDVFAQLAVLEPQGNRGFAFSVPVRLRIGN